MPKACVEVKHHHDYARKEDRWSGHIELNGMLIEVYPDTAKTPLGQKRQILKVGRAILRIMSKKLPKPYVSHLIGFNCHKVDMFAYHATGPSPNYESYVNKSRRKNRPNYITDSVLQVRFCWLGDWREASEKTWQMACAVAVELNKPGARLGA